MTELWNIDDFLLRQSKIDADVNNWQHPYTYTPTPKEHCTECNNILPGVDEGESRGLCRNCRTNTAVLDKYKVPCKVCGDNIGDLNRNPDQQYCPQHRVNCEDCGKQVDDLGGYCSHCLNPVEYGDDAESRDCKDCRLHCENCGEPVAGPGESQTEEGGSNRLFCEEHTPTCKHCSQPIEDIGTNDQYVGNYIEPEEDECKDCRAYCDNCGERVDNRGEYDRHGHYVDEDENHCEDCRLNCENCGERIKDLGEYDRHGNYVGEDANHCEDCRRYCITCGESINDLHQVPEDEEHCEDHRKYCEECGERVDDQGEVEKALNDGTIPDNLKWDPSNYCKEHRHPCEMCNNRIEDYEDALESDTKAKLQPKNDNWWQKSYAPTGEPREPLSTRTDSHKYCPECRYWTSKEI